jgi:phosphate transport system substrate-binding protein
MRSRSAALSVCLAVCLLSCGKQPQPGVASETATSGAFELVADETLKPVVDSLVADFNRHTPEAKVTVRYMVAASALDALLQNKARLVIIARPLTPRERSVLDSQKIDLPEFDIALNGLAVIAAKDNKLSSIPLDSLRQMGEGKLPLKYYSTSYLSATESSFDSIFEFKEKTLSGAITRFETSDSVINAIRTNPNAIGYISSPWYHQFASRGDSSIKSLRISSVKNPEPVQLHLAYMYQGSYPLVSRVCGYTNERPNTLPRGFLAYVMSADGQRIFMKYDVLPRTQIIRIVPSE